MSLSVRLVRATVIYTAPVAEELPRRAHGTTHADLVKNVAPAFDLAKCLGGTVSSSRSLVDAGIMEHNRQVGQTGKTVRPEAYLAFGISGAVQHLAGMEESEYIVAVNTDKSAPIFKVANLGIVADAGAVMKELNKLLNQ